jgi:hypothetical protein
MLGGTAPCSASFLRVDRDKNRALFAEIAVSGLLAAMRSGGMVLPWFRHHGRFRRDSTYRQTVLSLRHACLMIVSASKRCGFFSWNIEALKMNSDHPATDAKFQRPWLSRSTTAASSLSVMDVGG